MGKQSEFMKGTAATLRRVLDEVDASYLEASDKADQDEDRQQRLHDRERADLVAKYPIMRNR